LGLSHSGLSIIFPIDFKKIEDKALDECIASFDYNNPKGDEEFIITGLVFGYPIESTVSIILGN
jgi:hypothetical protein